MAFTFANAAARIAYVIDPIYEGARRKRCIQLDTNEEYEAISGGAGAANWELIGRPRIINYVDLNSFREVDANSDVGNIAANGGLLASDTTPILRGDAAETQEISWATGNVDPLVRHIPLNPAVSGGAISVELDVSSGTTNAATFTVETGFDGAALVSQSADDAATKSATSHTIIATVTAANVPDGARQMTLVLTPPAHATDTIQLLGCRVSY